ncbi:hypothetical protein FH5_04933 [Priestia endophytica]|nr:hypothetical protein FH5_04933 [Priestia endophytica]
MRPFTIRFYNNEVQAFLNHLQEQGIEKDKLKPYNVKEEHIQENIIRYIQVYKGARIVSINKRLRGLRAFFNFLHKKRYIPKNPMGNIKLLKDRKLVISTFSKQQLNTLFNQPDLTTFTGIRDYTIMMFFLETGIRVNELVGSSLSDIQWEDSMLRIRHAKTYR